MTKAAKTRIKSLSASSAQSRDDVITSVRKIGDLQRDLLRTQTTMNDEIAEITEFYAPCIESHKKEIAELQKSVQSWCESNRTELTNDNKVKTVNLVTGEVSWRIRPPSVSVRNVDVVIETLARMNLHSLIRVKQEVNKEAILSDPSSVRGVAGITVKSGIEDFIITPFEQDTGV